MMESQSFKKCFVIQRFDGATYDKRYRETFGPSIERGGAKPIRADEVLGTKPIVEKIEEGLRQADIAFAEISEDNPNVFLELGIALALQIPTVIVCDRSKRKSLPFDIAHRPVQFYSTDAQSDYENISLDVEKAIAAALIEARENKRVDTKIIEPSENVDEVKKRCLVALLDQTMRSPVGATLWELQKEVSSQGISERMISLALMSLIDQNLVQRNEDEDRGEVYNTFALSDSGMKFLLRSYSVLMQSEMESASSTTRLPTPSRRNPFSSAELDDDIPF